MLTVAGSVLNVTEVNVAGPEVCQPGGRSRSEDNARSVNYLAYAASDVESPLRIEVRRRPSKDVDALGGHDPCTFRFSS